MPRAPSTSATPSPHTVPRHLPPSVRPSRAAAAGLHLVFDAAGYRQHLFSDGSVSAGSPSSCSDASFSSASSAGPATPRSRACSPGAEDEDCWNLIPYHVPWGNEYYDYTPGMLPGPDGQCFFYRSPTPLKFKRTMRACTKCRDRKAKCSGDKPACTRCVARGYLCQYDPEEPKRAKGPELARQRLREQGTSSPRPARTSPPVVAAPSPRVVPKREEVDMLNELGELTYPVTEPDTEAWGGVSQGVPEHTMFTSEPYALQGALDAPESVRRKSSPQSPPLLIHHHHHPHHHEPEPEPEPAHQTPTDYWSYAPVASHPHHPTHLPTPTTPHPTSVHAPKPLKQVPPFLSAPRPDEPPPAAPPPIVIPQPPILQAALMAVPEHPAAPVPGASEQGQWHGAQAGLDAFVAYSAQELFGGYVAYDYAPVYAHGHGHGHGEIGYVHDAYSGWDGAVAVYGQGVGVAPAATYLAPVPAAPAQYVSYAV